jgi:hypothetical protein
MHLANAVSVVVPRPLPLGVADRGGAAAGATDEKSILAIP